LNLGLADYKINRNAYGNQLESFETTLKMEEFSVECAFIRAPKIEKLNGNEWEILASYGGQPVISLNGNLLVSTCHLELYRNSDFYNWFIGW
jgi:5'-phosphate synthase pdxT subunit